MLRLLALTNTDEPNVCRAQVPFRGPVTATILDLYGGVRSTCTYIGASCIKEMPKRTTFIRVTQQLNQIFGSHDLSKK